MNFSVIATPIISLPGVILCSTSRRVKMWHLVLKPSARVVVSCFVGTACDQRPSQSIGTFDYVIYYVGQLLCQGNIAILYGRNTRTTGWSVSAWTTAFHSETIPQGPPSRCLPFSPLPPAPAASGMGVAFGVMAVCDYWQAGGGTLAQATLPKKHGIGRRPGKGRICQE